jgi:hypothetical protein
MNAYEKLLNHITINRYTRGQYKGDAPLDGVRRRRTHQRVLPPTTPGGPIRIRMYNTDILTVHPDGSVRVTCGGWDTPTTRAAINDGLIRCGIYAHVCRVRVAGLSQTVLHSGGGRSALPATIGPDEKIINPTPLSGWVTDKEELAELRILAQPFMTMLPLLWAAASREDMVWTRLHIDQIAIEDEWPRLAATFAWSHRIAKRTLAETRREALAFLRKKAQHVRHVQD